MSFTRSRPPILANITYMIHKKYDTKHIWHTGQWLWIEGHINRAQPGSTVPTGLNHNSAVVSRKSIGVYRYSIGMYRIYTTVLYVAIISSR